MLKTISSITNALGALNYKGTWNASTNTPTLTSSVGAKGDYYVVSVAGSTNLNGEILWGVGDWAVFNGSVWQRVEGGDTINATTVSASTSVSTPVIQSLSSAGGTIKNNGGTNQMQWGSGGGNNLSLEVATNINPANAAVNISPTGTGTVTINPATASTMNNVAIGGTTALAGRFTDVTATTGNLVVNTTAKGVTTGSAIPLGLGVNTAVNAATIDTSSNFNIGQTTAISGAKLTVNGQIATSPFTAINSSSATTVATGVSFLAVLRDRGNAGTAIVLYDNNSSPAVVIVSQTGAAKFVTTAPLATEIQIANGGNAITALTGATIGTTNLNVSIFQNQ